VVLERREGFLLGMGGGAGLRRTRGPLFWVVDEKVAGWAGRLGRERVDALDAVRLRSSSASRPPSKFELWVACVGNAGTMSFRAGGSCDDTGPSSRERDVEGVMLVSLKSTVRALCVPLAGGGSGLPLLLTFFTSTQSGSGLGVKGLRGRFALGNWWSDGG
jgi:hypothetical protein